MNMFSMDFKDEETVAGDWNYVNVYPIDYAGTLKRKIVEWLKKYHFIFEWIQNRVTYHV